MYKRQAPRAAAAAPTAALPAGLRRAVEGYAAAAGAPSFEVALDAYVRGDAAVVAFVAPGGAVAESVAKIK